MPITEIFFTNKGLKSQKCDTCSLTEMSTLYYNFLMQFTAEAVKEILKNYHIYRGRVACGTASREIELMLDRLQFALYLCSDGGLIEDYYIRKKGSLSDIAKGDGCSKNNIAKKLNRIIKELAEIMSDDEQTMISSATDASPKYTDKQVRKYLYYLRADNSNSHGKKVDDENYRTDKDRLTCAIHALDKIDQEMVLAVYLYGENLSVIGNTYGYSVSGVKYRINVAIKKICAMMDGSC